MRRKAALRAGNGRSRTVVQLGAFDSRSLIAGAWSRAASRHAALRNYTPVTARFASAKGTFYRLSVKGFTSDREAMSLCSQLKRSGATASFVRPITTSRSSSRRARLDRDCASPRLHPAFPQRKLHREAGWERGL